MFSLRSSAAFLGIAILALLIAALRLATERTPLPTGSSYSVQPDGALALYNWIEALGGSARRLRDASVDEGTASVLILQPETVLDASTRSIFDSVLARGGTLLLAGDSPAWLFGARNLGVSVDPVSPGVETISTPDGLSLSVGSRYRLHADGAEPLLVRQNGDWIGLRMPYKQGTLIVIASSELLSNAGLRDVDTARFVYRQGVAPVAGQTVAFDEVHHSFAPSAPGPATINTLLFETPPGRAVIYAGLLTFVYLLLSGRRLGPPLPARQPSDIQRTMYEHVQMLANLYRRARQLRVVRDAFSRHYARLIARGGAGSKRAAVLAEALARIQSARTESELIAAVAAVDDAD